MVILASTASHRKESPVNQEEAAIRKWFRSESRFVAQEAAPMVSVPADPE